MKVVLALLLTAILALSSSTTLAQQPGMTTQTFTSEQLCAQIVMEFTQPLVNNMLGGATKEQQIRHMQETLFPNAPASQMFEPAIRKMLDALYAEPNYITVENVQETAPQFARATFVACVRDQVEGWIQSVPGIIEINPEGVEPPPPQQPRTLPAPRMKKGEQWV